MYSLTTMTEPELKQSLPVPSEYAGAIIGSQGATIDSIVNGLEGVYINSKKQNGKKNAKWTYFYICGGNLSAQDEAKKRIIINLVKTATRQKKKEEEKKEEVPET